MTTYILHGGASSNTSPLNEYYYRLVGNVIDKDETRVLMCNWARPKDKWEEVFLRDKVTLVRHGKSVMNVDLLTTYNEFKNKLSSYDMLYISGGWSEYLQPFMSDLEQITKEFEGKVIVGTSMGAFVIAQNYVLSLDDKGQDMRKVHKGFGLLPINVLCHWDIEIQKEMKLQALKKVSDLPTLTLDECQSVLLYK